MKKKRPSRQNSVNTPGTPTSPPFGVEPKTNKFFSFSRFFDGNRKIFESSPSFFSTTKTSATAIAPCDVSSQIVSENHKTLIQPQQINTTPSLIESGSQPRTGDKLLVGGRPVPLTRRSSFPALMGQQFMPAIRVRRPSMDSLSEGDSSPDVKRRVRMIHRH